MFMESRTLRIVAAMVLAALPGCAAPQAHRHIAQINTPCSERAVQIIARNVDAISSHRYAEASRTAEKAARLSLSCAATEPSRADRFSDRWRGANALVVAAELAHQAAQQGRANRLLAEGYGIMHSLQPPAHVSALTSTLISQTRDGAERDMRGQWSYW
jgi:hypothetical protein